MKRKILCLILIIQTGVLLAQSSSENPIGKFALSVNPLGFLQFGPSVSADVGLTNKLVLDMHYRAPSLGLLSYVVAADPDLPDKLSGSAGGLGLLYFLGERKNKFYLGGIFGIQSMKATYSSGATDEWYKNLKSNIFMFNGGYRIRTNSGFFMNAGAFLGVAFTNWDWEYTYPALNTGDLSPRTGTDTKPFGVLEFSLGYEFK